MLFLEVFIGSGRSFLRLRPGSPQILATRTVALPIPSLLLSVMAMIPQLLQLR